LRSTPRLCKYARNADRAHQLPCNGHDSGPRSERQFRHNPNVVGAQRWAAATARVSLAPMSANADRPRPRNLNPLRSLLPFLRPYRGMMVAALGALLVATAAMLALPLALRQLIDHIVAAKDSSSLNGYLFGFLAASVIFGVFAALRFYLVTWLGDRVVADLRSAVYRRVVRMDPLFYETTRVGEVLSRLTTDTTLVQAISGVNLSIILRSTLSLVGAIVLMGFTSAKLMGVILILIPVVIAPLIITGRRVRGLSRASQDRI